MDPGSARIAQKIQTKKLRAKLASITERIDSHKKMVMSKYGVNPEADYGQHTISSLSVVDDDKAPGSSLVCKDDIVGLQNAYER